MCFSASASFAASGGLAIIGGASLAIAPKKQRVLALVPLIFAVQQALEGIQWLALDRGSVCTVAGYGFLFFALLLWPVCLPLAVCYLDKVRRPIMKLFIVAGASLAAWFGFLLVDTPLVIQTFGQHIFYDPPGSFDWTVPKILYIVVILGTLVLSSKRTLRYLGLIVLVSMLFSLLISWNTAASVWCFFAACISVSTYMTIRYKWL